MPHKHKRRQNDESTYDLPPTLIAKALPVRDPSATGKSQQGKGKGKGKGKGNGKPNTSVKPQAKNGKNAVKQKEAVTSRRKTDLDDDTPRAFRQMMQFQERRQAAKSQKRKRDGEESDSDSSGDETAAAPQKDKNKNKNKTRNTETEPSETETNAAKQALKILPGEKLSDFAARVDREMPLSQMKRSSKPTATDDLPKLQDHKVTKHEKHLKRLQAQWREDDVRIKEREAAEREEREEEMEEQLQLWKDWDAEAGKKKRNPNHSGKKRKGGDDDDGPDPWAKLKKKRAAVNPFDVAQEPPQLKKPREIFKVKGGAKVDVANVPAAVGSLRRREELANERRNIVEEYRRLMAEKRQA